MARISSGMINSSALIDLQKAQSELYETQRKTATQRAADDLKGYGSDARTVVSLQRMQAQTDAYKSSAEQLTTRLDLQDAHIGRAAESIQSLRESLTNALALGDLSSVAQELENTFTDIKSSFNASLNGKYLFSGNTPSEQPIIADDISDLANNPLADSVYSESEALQVRITESKTVEAGPLGHEVALDALSVLRDLQIFEESGSGPFTDNPTTAEKDAIQAALSQLGSIYEGLLGVQGENGRVLNETDNAVERLETESNLLASLSADITDVDLAEVALELSQAQLQYQATASVFNTIQNLSLVNLLE